MKQYRETGIGTYVIGGTSIPKDKSNRHYRKMLEEVTAGKAEIAPFDHQAKARQDAINVERQWRNGELQRADIEVFKAEDTAGAFNAEDWRSYRQTLRAWPASPDFPDSAKRPAAPA